MADFLTQKGRSLRMGAIKGRGNQSTEVALARLFRVSGISGWRKHKKILGKPDFVFPEIRLALFVDGCFWHGCAKHFTPPVGNAEFWSSKILANRARDKFVTKELRKRGWRVLRIWEHDLKRKQNHSRLLHRINEALSCAAQATGKQ